MTAANLRDPEVRRLLTHGEVLVVRALRKQPVGHRSVWDQRTEPGDWFFDIAGELWEAFESRSWPKRTSGVLGQRRVKCPLGQPGDVVVGKECWRIVSHPNAPYSGVAVEYKAGGTRYLEFDEYDLAEKYITEAAPWRSSSSMPPALSRFPRMPIVSVGCRRVSTIAEEEAIAAGYTGDTEQMFYTFGIDWNRRNPRAQLIDAWAWFMLLRKE